MGTSYFITGAKIVLPHAILQEDLRCNNGLITEIGKDLKPRPGETIIQLRDKYILPGFVDIHSHGARGFDSTFGTFSPVSQEFFKTEEAYIKGLETALAYYASTGTTSLLCTAMAAPLSTLVQSFSYLRQYAQTSSSLYSKIIAGINLEGSFIKSPRFAGAQNPNYFLPPRIETFKKLQEAAGGLIRIVNMPPEHGTDSYELITKLKQERILIAAGHSAAYATQVADAIKNGLGLAVHFLNGPSLSSTKSFWGGGAVEAFLQRDEISLEIIADGYHVHPAMIRDAIVRKGLGRIIIITDSMFATGSEQIQTFELAGIKGTLSPNGEYLQVQGKANTLFGSVLRMDRAFEKLLNWLTVEMEGIWHRTHPALSLEEAIACISQMMSGNAAELLANDSMKGRIEVGNKADLLVAAIEKGEQDYDFRIEDVFIEGERLN